MMRGWWNQSISSASAGETIGSWIVDEVEPLTLGGSSWGDVGRGAKAASSAFHLSSSSSPLIRNSFTLLARVLGTRDVVPMGSGGCDPSFPPRMSPETLFTTLESLLRAGSYSLVLGKNKKLTKIKKSKCIHQSTPAMPFLKFDLMMVHNQF